MTKLDERGYKEHQVSEPMGGFPKFGYTRELPIGLSSPRVTRNLTEQLLFALRERGYDLLQVDEQVWGGKGDPFVLYNEWGEIVAEWETMPSLGELLAVSKGA